MYSKFIPMVSEEQLGAFLEGKLSESENSRIKSLIYHDESLKEILEVNDIVDDCIKEFETSGFQFDKDIIDIDSFELPTIEIFEMSHVDGFDLSDTDDNQNEDLYSIDGDDYTSFNIEEDIQTFNPDNTSSL